MNWLTTTTDSDTPPSVSILAQADAILETMRQRAEVKRQKTQEFRRARQARYYLNHRDTLKAKHLVWDRANQKSYAYKAIRSTQNKEQL